MQFIFSYSQPHGRFVSIELKVDGPFKDGQIELQLPSWRPGRYELGNFAKNIVGFHAENEKNDSMPFKKVSKDKWLIKVAGKTLVVKYRYFASQPDAGACWIDDDQMYINPIHCCMYVPGREDEPIGVNLQIPESWKVATGLKKLKDHEFVADNFDQLADSPFIASDSLQHGSYTVRDITFNIWFQGECAPDWIKIIKDFEAFTVSQLEMMKEFPVKEFHFLVVILPHTFYHGVEHLSSTVLALGPGINMMKPALYNDFLGVASHELFHVWNVKTIRPVEMYPYNFTAENYARTGFVYEGITTYYGDLFLGRSGFFNINQLLEEYSVRLQKHMDNAGRFNYSVAESSFDTWLDGYVPGVPGRKTSIYDEGCLLAWILDFMIRSSTDSHKSLDQVMQVLYFDFAKKGKGYSETDFTEIAEMVGGRSFTDFFENYVYKAASLNSLLSEVVSLAGIYINSTPSSLAYERQLGLRVENRLGTTAVSGVYPGSPGAAGGMLKDDEIIAVNDLKIENNLNDLLDYFKEDEVQLTIFSSRKLRKVQLLKTEQTYFNKYTFAASEELTASQLYFRNKWLNK